MNRRPSLVVPTALLSLFGLLGLWAARSMLAPPSAPSDAAAQGAAARRGAQAGGASHSRGPAPLSGAPAPASAGRASPGTADLSPYLTHEVMVSAADAEALHRVASRHGSRVSVPRGPSGWAGLAVPEGVDRDTFIAGLLEDPEVADAAPEGRIAGAALPVGPSTTRGNKFQWHLAAIHTPPVGTLDCTGVTVAVIDTGVAFETATVGGVSYAVAPTLQATPFVAPWDFVNNDAHPNDDHMHGTHIASLLASTGAMEGVCPGMSLMPLKVLDADNQGTELALVNALSWAADHGADVVNMSLSFSLGYAPSHALAAALEEVSLGGAVLVSAAGNTAQHDITYPASNPLVIAVAADRPASKTTFLPAGYSNNGTRADLVASGGSLSFDLNKDGYVDGVLAETITPGAPATPRYVFMAGTSQATALVTGAVAALLAEGAAPGEVKELLQSTATPLSWTQSPYTGLWGAGRLNIEAALAAVGSPGTPAARHYHVSIMPYLLQDTSPGVVLPKARVTVFDEDGALADGVTVAASMWGSGFAALSCVTVDGMCTITGPSKGGAGATTASWRVSVDQIISDGVGHHPRPGLVWSEGLDQLIAAMQDDPDAADALLSFHWRAGADADLGPLAESYALVNHGVGIFNTPTALLLTPARLDSASIVAEGEVEWSDGSGLVSSPLGFTFTRGAGLVSSPLGFTIWSLPTGLASSPVLTALSIDGEGLSAYPGGPTAQTVLSGAGLVSSPLGFRPLMLGSGLVSSPLGYNAGFGTLIDPTSPTAGLLGAGGWVTGSGLQEGAAVFSASSGELAMSSVHFNGTEVEAIEAEAATCDVGDACYCAEEAEGACEETAELE